MRESERRKKREIWKEREKERGYYIFLFFPFWVLRKGEVKEVRAVKESREKGREAA